MTTSQERKCFFRYLIRVIYWELCSCMYVSCGKENTTLCSSSTREFARKENEAAYIYIYIRAAVPCLGGREIRRPTSPTGNARGRQTDLMYSICLTSCTHGPSLCEHIHSICLINKSQLHAHGPVVAPQRWSISFFCNLNFESHHYTHVRTSPSSDPVLCLIN
jgi:hypothetical protein